MTFDSIVQRRKKHAQAHAAAQWLRYSGIDLPDTLRPPGGPGGKTPKQLIQEYCKKRSMTPTYSVVYNPDCCVTLELTQSSGGSSTSSPLPQSAAPISQHSCRTMHQKYCEHKAATEMLRCLAKEDALAAEQFASLYPPDLICRGALYNFEEGRTVELKGAPNPSDFMTCATIMSQYLTTKDHSVGAYVCGFLNSRVDGKMVLGVHDSGWIQGVKIDSRKEMDKLVLKQDSLWKQFEPELPLSILHFEPIDVLILEKSWSSGSTSRVLPATGNQELYQVITRLQQENTKLNQALRKLGAPESHEIDEATTLKLLIYNVKGSEATRTYQYSGVWYRKTDSGIESYTPEDAGNEVAGAVADEVEEM